MRTKAIVAITAVLIIAGLSVLVAGAASHSDAPLISQDRSANNTDVYAFVSTDPDRPNHVTLIANYIPMIEPGDGPNFLHPENGVQYEINVDVDGDAKEDITYRFDFETTQGAVSKATFVYAAGQIGQPPDQNEPDSQYTGLNIPTSYNLTEYHSELGRTVLLTNARTAPHRVGPNVTGSFDEYLELAASAVHTIEDEDIQVFAGPRDEGFFVDLGGCCLDVPPLNLRNPGVDTFSGFNVYSLAVEIPMSRLEDAGDTDGVIGVWATASRKRVRIMEDGGKPPTDLGSYMQVSRMGNPLVNELLMPISVKDKYNASHPKTDGAKIGNIITDPGTSGAELTLVPVIVGAVSGPDCNTPVNGRSDLDLALLSGIPAGVLGFPGNQDTQRPGGLVRADMVRLNYHVEPATEDSYSPLGIFGGDVAGFPNGRRVGDDVVDIEARVAAGAVLHLLGAVSCPVSLGLSDNVQGNDADYLDHFPYLGTPHQAYDHEHGHAGVTPLAALGIGSGLLASGLALGAVFAVRRRRNSDSA